MAWGIGLLQRLTDLGTGDTLTVSDRVSWFAQTLIRRWSFVGFNIVFSIIYWIHFGILSDPATAWNVTYSLLAIVVESIVGIGMFAQTKRDAIILRHVKDVADKLLTLEQLILEETEEAVEDATS